jgi:hypothetical protein
MRHRDDRDDDPCLDPDLLRDEYECEADSTERFGIGVCVRGTCDEPCGPDGGCVAGTERRGQRR